MKIYIDVGSSTVKVYSFVENNLNLLETKSFHFKNMLINDIKKELIDYLKYIKINYKWESIKIFATAFFRKLEENEKQNLIDEIFEKTWLFFNIISQDLESFYLEEALSSEYLDEKPILLINIWWGSTELIIKEKNQIIKKINLEIWVWTVLKDFPKLNEKFSAHKIEEIVENLLEKIPNFENKIDTAIYNGGELTYMKLVNYSLEKNIIFEDKKHPFYIKSEKFFEKNKEVFEKISLEELESLMPNDPKWMHWARACSVIAESILKKFFVKNLIPSDSNTIDWVVKKEFRNVVLSWSFRKHLDYILNIKRDLENKKIEILSPKFDIPKNPWEEFVVFHWEEWKSALELERNHLNLIEKSDTLIVCNKDWYVWASTLIEIWFANKIWKKIIFAEKPNEFMLQTLPSEIWL